MRKSYGWKFIISIAAAIWILVSASVLTVQAGDERIVSALILDETMYLYVQGISDDSEISVQIGSSVIEEEDIYVSGLQDMDVPMRTMILLDNSLSIPSEDRTEILDMIDAIIDGRMDNELIRIGVYSDQVVWMSEFTADQSVLSSAAEAITFENQSSYLSDILYEVILDLEEEKSGIYTRILIITDGADDKTIGYTNEEVRSLISSVSWPIYTVGVQISDNSSELETLFSFSRASSGTYYLLHEDSTEQIVSGLLADQENLCIAVSLEESMLDGGSRSVRLRLETTEGVTELSTSVTMPFADSAAVDEDESDISDTGDGSGSATSSQEQDGSDGSTAQETETVEEDVTENAGDDDSSEEESGEETPVLDLTGSSVTEEGSDSNALFPYEMSEIRTAAGVFALVVIVGIVLFLLVRRMSGREHRAGQSDQAVPRSPVYDSGESYDGFKASGAEETVCSASDEDDEATLMMGSGDGVGRDMDMNYLILTNLDRPKTRYKFPLQGMVSIGRLGTDIVITDDPEVSRLHCRIELREGSLYLEDVGSRNGTMYENRRIPKGQPTLIAAGGRVKIGKYTYSADLMQQR